MNFLGSSSVLTNFGSVPGRRYALTLQLMLKRSKRRQADSSSVSPKVSRNPHRSVPMDTDAPPNNLPPQTTTFQHRSSEPFSPYDTFPSQDYPGHSTISIVNPMPQHYPHLPYPHLTEADHTWRGSEQTPSDQLPVWMTDHSLGGTLFSQHGMDAFIMPTEYVSMATAPQIWQ